MHYNDEQTKDCVMCASSEKLNCEVSWELFKTTYIDTVYCWSRTLKLLASTAERKPSY